MRLNSKGQVTIPAELRRRHHLEQGDEVDVVEQAGGLRIVRTTGPTTGERLVANMRGRATTGATTDELLALLRGE